MAHEAFISHSSKDKIAADAVVAHLERAGIRCWVAPRDIVPGKSWADSIMKAIKECQVMVIVFSSNANKSAQVPREIERAVSRGVPIVPVRIEDVLPDGQLEYFLSSSHWMDAISPPIERHLDALAVKLRMLLSLPSQVGPETPRPKETPAPPPGLPRRRAVAALPRFLSRRTLTALAITLSFLVISIFSYRAVLPRLINSPSVLEQEFREYQDQLRRGSSLPYLKSHAPMRYAEWLHDAEKGNAIAEFFVARCCEEGVGTPKDDALALKWDTLSANQGNTFAMNNLGWMYDNGRGVPKDHAASLRWYRMATDQGNGSAMLNLGASYESDEGGAHDYAEAMKWYRKAADAGYPIARRYIGNFYKYGYGVPKDPIEAIKQYQQAADAGDTYAAGLLVAERIGPAFAAYTAGNATETAKAAGLTTAQNAMSEFNALDLSAAGAALLDDDVAVAAEKMRKDSAVSPLLALYDKMIEQYMRLYQQADLDAKATYIESYAKVSAFLITKKFENKQYDDISAFWQASYEGLTVAAFTDGDKSEFITQLGQCVNSMLKAGNRKEAKQLLTDALALCDGILTERPWDWYAKEAYSGLCFASADTLSELGESEEAQPLLRRAWDVKLKEYSKPELLTRYAPLPLKGKIPDGASAEDAVFFARFAPGAKDTKDSDEVKFTIPTDFNGVKYPFDVYVIKGPNGYAELQDQFRWVKEVRGGVIPPEVRASFLRLNEIAVENSAKNSPVDFMELCVYALGTEKTDPKK